MVSHSSVVFSQKAVQKVPKSLGNPMLWSQKIDVLVITWSQLIQSLLRVAQNVRNEKGHLSLSYTNQWFASLVGCFGEKLWKKCLKRLRKILLKSQYFDHILVSTYPILAWNSSKRAQRKRASFLHLHELVVCKPSWAFWWNSVEKVPPKT